MTAITENITLEEFHIDEDFLANILMTWARNESNRRSGKPTQNEISGEDFKRYFIELTMKLINAEFATKK